MGGGEARPSRSVADSGWKFWIPVFIAARAEGALAAVRVLFLTIGVVTTNRVPYFWVHVKMKFMHACKKCSWDMGLIFAIFEQSLLRMSYNELL